MSRIQMHCHLFHGIHAMFQHCQLRLLPFHIITDVRQKELLDQLDQDVTMHGMNSISCCLAHLVCQADGSHYMYQSICVQTLALGSAGWECLFVHLGTDKSWTFMLELGQQNSCQEENI